MCRKEVEARRRDRNHREETERHQSEIDLGYHYDHRSFVGCSDSVW